RKPWPGLGAGLNQGGAGALVAAGGAAYDLVHSDAALLEQLPGDGGRQVVPEVAGDRGQVRGVRLEAALRAAQAAWAVAADGDVPELTRRVPVTPNQLAVD